MKYEDQDRLDFLEKWEISNYDNTRFTLLTQHVDKKKCPTLRDFCDYAIEMEQMLDANELSPMDWHFLPPFIQEMIETIWLENSRPLNENERDAVKELNDEYWKSLAEHRDK
jgi:hypothetical protein